MTEDKRKDQETAEPAPEKQEKTGKKSTNPVDALWKFFSNVTLAIILLLLLAGISIIGTVLAQGDSGQDNIQLFENMIIKVYDTLGVVDPADQAAMAAKYDQIHLAAERLYRFSVRAGFTNLYHAWYFYFLLALFSLNILVCTIRRWPLSWKLIAKNPVALDPKRFRTMSNRRTIPLALSLEEAAAKVQADLARGGYKPKTEKGEGALSYFGQKGTYSRLGVYATHLSIIIILIGGIIGVTSGFKGYMQITEGTASDKFYNRRTKKTNILPFQVRCDNFQVDYYGGGGRRPKDYYSDLTVIDGGEEKMSLRIEVNSPLVYDDIWFYQSSYGETGRGMRAALEFTVPGTGASASRTVDAPPMRSPATPPIEIEELGITFQIIQVLPDFALDQNQRPYSKSNQTSNPAALVELTTAEGGSARMWLFQAYPDAEMAKDSPVQVVFKDYSGVQYTGLQVVYDPGVWVIWLGCSVMIIGLYLAFFISHRRVWARIEESEGGVQVVLAGSANKNRDGFKEEFAKLANLMEGKAVGETGS